MTDLDELRKAAEKATVFAWAWTLFGNGSIWQRRLTFTKDDPFAFEVSISPDSFTSVPVPLYTDSSPALDEANQCMASLQTQLADAMRALDVAAADLSAIADSVEGGGVSADWCRRAANSIRDFRRAALAEPVKEG